MGRGRATAPWMQQAKHEAFTAVPAKPCAAAARPRSSSARSMVAGAQVSVRCTRAFLRKLPLASLFG